MHLSILSLTSHMRRLPYLPLFNHFNHIWRIVQIMKLLFVLYSPSSCYLLSLRSNILLTLLLSITFSLFYVFVIRDQILYHIMEPEKLYFLLFVFTNRRWAGKIMVLGKLLGQ